MSYFFDSRYGSFRWEMLKSIESEIYKVDGTIFGGYVLDTIIHNHYAEMFYKAKEEARQSTLATRSNVATSTSAVEEEPLIDVDYIIDRTAQMSLNDPESDPDKMDVDDDDENDAVENEETQEKRFVYSDKKSHPESWPRRVWQPDDIDFVIHPTKLETFLFNMKKSGFECTKLFTKQAMCYIPTVDTAQMKHVKFHIQLRMPERFIRYVSCPVISLDVITDPNYEIGKTVVPYGEYDFECNRIVLTKMGYNILKISHPMRKLEELNRTIEDILAFRATPKNATPYRMMRMLMKGFTVKTAAFTAYRGSQELLEGRCLHCLEEFRFTDYTIKNNCCEARYHIRCYPLTQKSGEECKYNNVDYCALCRGVIPKK